MCVFVHKKKNRLCVGERRRKKRKKERRTKKSPTRHSFFPYPSSHLYFFLLLLVDDDDDDDDADYYQIFNIGPSAQLSTLIFFSFDRTDDTKKDLMKAM